jgi:hypothetical protein
LGYLTNPPESLSTFYASNDGKRFRTLAQKLGVGVDSTGKFLPDTTQAVFMVNLWHYKGPHSWYVHLGVSSISFGVRGSTVRTRPLSNTYNAPDVVDEMIGIDGVQPHSDPVRRGQSFSCLVVHTVSVRTDVPVIRTN